MRVAVIGGAGRMGKWLTEYLLNQGQEVFLSDARLEEAKAVASSTGSELAKDNLEAVRGADLVVVSTPIEITPRVLKEITPELRQSAAVVEISSLKSQVIPVLEEIAERGVRALSVHPALRAWHSNCGRREGCLDPGFRPNLRSKIGQEPLSGCGDRGGRC